MIRSVREWTHSPDKGSWGKELRDAEALFLCKKICYNGGKTASEQNKSFRPPFLKGGGVQRQRLWPPSAEGGTLLSSGAFEEVWNPFAREKGSKNRLMVVVNLKNYPVDDF